MARYRVDHLGREWLRDTVNDSLYHLIALTISFTPQTFTPVSSVSQVLSVPVGLPSLTFIIIIIIIIIITTF